MQEQLEEVERRLASVRKFNDDLQADIKKYTDGIEQNNQAMMELLNSKGTIQSKEQRLDTMLEQINIRKAQLNQRLLQRKTEEDVYKRQAARSGHSLPNKRVSTSPTFCKRATPPVAKTWALAVA